MYLNNRTLDGPAMALFAISYAVLSVCFVISIGLIGLNAELGCWTIPVGLLILAVGVYQFTKAIDHCANTLKD